MRGRLAAGALGDLAVLNDDYFGVDEDAIPALRSGLTPVGGRAVHAAAPFAGVQTEFSPRGSARRR